LSRKLRQAALFTLLGICLAACAVPQVAWSQAPEPPAKDEKKEENPNRELLYKTVNLFILVGALVYLLRKPMGEFFRSRSASITKSLDEGRKALEASQARLKEVEVKLGKLEAEIAAFKESAMREMEADRARMQQAAAEEAARIVDSARAQMDTAVRAARLELKGYAATKAVALAEDLIRARLDDSGQRRLVTQFASTLETKDRKN
jgi:F-type H+-transporting ATPase subunit b